MTNILIVDDHPLVRAGFSQLIGDTPDLKVCGEAGDMASALKLLDSVTPDLAIIDLSLAGGSNKQEAQEKIILAIRQVLDGKVYLSEHMTERILDNIVSGSDDKRGIETLSNRELQVFEMIGQGIAPGKMAKQLNLSVKTIETHQAHIKKKLGLTSAHKLTHRAIRWVLEQGQ